MEPGGSLQYSKKPVIYPYPEPDKSSPQPSIPFFEINFNVIFLSTLRFYKWTLFFSFPCQDVLCIPPLLQTVSHTAFISSSMERNSCVTFGNLLIIYSE
jgi:hypothetical protein